MKLIRLDLPIPIIDPFSCVCPQKSWSIQSAHWPIIQTIPIYFSDSNCPVIKFMISAVRDPNSLIVNHFSTKRSPLINSGSPISNSRALHLLNHFLFASNCFMKSLFLNRLSSAAESPAATRKSPCNSSHSNPYCSFILKIVSLIQNPISTFYISNFHCLIVLKFLLNFRFLLISWLVYLQDLQHSSND